MGFEPFETQIIEAENLILQYTYLKNLEDFSWKLTEMQHMHIEYELHFVVAGECSIFINDNCHTLKKNSICIIPKKQSHSFPYCSHDCEGISFMLSVKDNFKNLSDEKKGIIKKHLNVLDNFRIIENNYKCMSYILDFMNIYQQKKLGSKSMKQSLLTMVFFEILNSNVNEEAVFSHSYEDVRTKEMLVLENCIMGPENNIYSLKDISKKIGFSSTHTARLIKKYFGTSYSELVLKIRMDRAQSEITQTDKPFSSIALNLGYDSYNGFAIAFKKYFGVTPEYMRKNRISN